MISPGFGKKEKSGGKKKERRHRRHRLQGRTTKNRQSCSHCASYLRSVRGGPKPAGESVEGDAAIFASPPRRLCISAIILLPPGVSTFLRVAKCCGKYCNVVPEGEEGDFASGNYIRPFLFG